MDEILVAGSIMAGQAVFFGLVLAIAYRWLNVEDDPRIEIVEGKLPGSNCGACGEPGCHAFAEKVVAGALAPGGCTVNSAEGIEDIASFLGTDAGIQEKRVARLHCAGGKSSVQKLADYRGLTSCRAAFVVNGGGRSCTWGCLGLADCEVACTFDAIHMNHEELPVVSVDKCTACRDCVDVCPMNLFTIEALSSQVIVQCSSPLKGDTARAVCDVACDACGRCAIDAPEGVIEMVGGLPRINVPARATEEATLRCPTGAIQVVAEDQFDESIDHVEAGSMYV